MDHLVRLFRTRCTDEQSLVQAVCAQAVELVPRVRDAGVILVGSRNRLEVIAATGAGPRQIDAVQRRTGSGPCLTAALTREVVRVDDLAADPRWPECAACATGTGVGSMLCLPLHVDTHLFGTLSLFAPRPHDIDPAAEPVATLMATLAAITLSEFRGRANLETALVNRDLIGQAKGILMATRRVTADDAFALLVQHSQHTNTKLIAVARTVADTGTLDPG